MDPCSSPGLMPLNDALTSQLSAINAVTESECVKLEASLDRVVAYPIKAPINVPQTDNSAMDGFAVAFATNASEVSFEIVGEALAGHPFTQSLLPGQAIRIMTGAIVPVGTDSVEMIENCKVSGTQLMLENPVSAGKNIREQGSDITEGTELLAAGSKINASHIAMLASLGIGELQVWRKPKIGIVSTGDELLVPGQPLQHGHIFESNRFGLRAMLSRFAVDILDYGILADDPKVIKDTFQKAAKECDWLISSGGVSVGDADFVKTVLDDIGHIGFWKVAIKPGKPYAFGNIGECWFSGLPGNPVSSFVTFLQLVVPCLQKLSGCKAEQATQFVATLGKEIKRRAGRLDFQRGRFYQLSDGKFEAMPNENQGSGIMTSFLEANCFILIPPEAERLSKGSQVTVIPFDHMLR